MRRLFTPYKQALRRIFTAQGFLLFFRFSASVILFKILTKACLYLIIALLSHKLTAAAVYIKSVYIYYPWSGNSIIYTIFFLVDSLR